MSERTFPAAASLASRVRRRLRSFEPMYLALLGLVALPSYVVDSLAILEVFELFFLFFLWPFVSPLLDLALRRGADETSAEPTDWIDMGSGREYVAWFLLMPLTLLNPLALAQDFLQWLGSGLAYVRHRGTVPDAESYDQQGSYRLPVDGTWTVVNGSYDHDYSHSWFPLTQRYAYDFVITDDDGRTSPAESGSAVDSYYCYDEPILAPADGVVVDAFDTAFESSRGGGLSHPLKRDIRGNYVVLKHAPDEYSCLAHLVPGSVAVSPGDRVERGTQIGRCGHSGNSSEPHLHFQLQDHPRFELAAGLPIAFDDVTVEWPGTAAELTEPRPDRNEATDDGLEEAPNDRAYLTAGQRVTHADPEDRGDAGTPGTTDDPGRSQPVTGNDAGLAALQRAAFGACVGGVIAFLAAVFVARSAVVFLLAAGTTAAVGWWLWLEAVRGATDVSRPGGLGIVAGLALVATAVWYVESSVQSLGVAAIAVGFVGYTLLGEYDRRRLRDSVPDPSSHA